MLRAFITLHLAIVASAVSCDTPAKVKVVVKDIWCQETHPHDFTQGVLSGPFPPSGGAHTSPPVLAIHPTSVEMWKVGDAASTGVCDVARTGNPAVLQSELAGKILSSYSGTPIASCGSSSATIDQVAVLDIDKSNSVLSTIHMMAPSPDFFTGISSLNLCVDGEWIVSEEVKTQPYDAGCDSAPNFSHIDTDTIPPGVITEILPSSGMYPVFTNDGIVYPVASYSISVFTCCSVSDAQRKLLFATVDRNPCDDSC